MPVDPVVVVGAGLAGCEAALWLADRGLAVTLWEQKPLKYSPAHTSEGFAELVCSNSLKAERLESAAGMLKAEMRLMGSCLLPAADATRVPAGGALSVDRGAFSRAVTARVRAHPGITVVTGEAKALPPGPAIIATGPLTEGPLAQEIAARAGGMLRFYDAAAPIVTAESLDMGEVFAASRYGNGEADYLNCPFDKAGYEAFYEELIHAEGAELHEVDRGGRPDSPEGCDAKQHTPEGVGDARHRTGQQSKVIPVYEGCMPVEILARRGLDTLRFGPLKPVGLVNPKTGHRPWANVQLRRENREGTLYNLVGFQTNLRFGEQKRVFSMIPGLANAEFARYGVMHRNTFLNSPRVLGEDLRLKGSDALFFAGQITGFEGYMESAACGLLAARALYDHLRGERFVPPLAETMCGALLAYITAENRNFQPMGANLGVLPPLGKQIRDKRLRAGEMARRGVAAMEVWNRRYKEEGMP